MGFSIGGTLGRIAGGLIGSAVGGPVGGAIGSQFGGRIGGQITDGSGGSGSQSMANGLSTTGIPFSQFAPEGATGPEIGEEAKGYYNTAFPGTNPWEQLGASNPMGAVSIAEQNQKANIRVQENAQRNQLKIATRDQDIKQRLGFAQMATQAGIAGLKAWADLRKAGITAAPGHKLGDAALRQAANAEARTIIERLSKEAAAGHILGGPWKALVKAATLDIFKAASGGPDAMSRVMKKWEAQFKRLGAHKAWELFKKQFTSIASKASDLAGDMGKGLPSASSPGSTGTGGESRRNRMPSTMPNPPVAPPRPVGGDVPVSIGGGASAPPPSPVFIPPTDLSGGGDAVPF